MQKTALPFQESCIGVAELKRYAEGWILDSEYRQLSPQTLYSRRLVTSKLVWFLQQREYVTCGATEIKAFLAYVSTGHEDHGGRWGNPQLTKRTRPVTAGMYFARLRTFFRFLIDEGGLTTSPMANLKPPVARADQIQPFTEEQVTTILSAAKRSSHPKRDEAICLLLLDSGIRASELCDLRIEDLDLQGRRATVIGKGNKRRAIFLSRDTAKALWNYLKERKQEPNQPLFISDRGKGAGEPLTRSGLRQLIVKLGRTAKIEAARCSPHTFRHTAAVWFLRNGGQVFALQQMLGHTDLKMTQRYVALAQADVQNQHQQYSPVERLRKGRTK